MKKIYTFKTVWALLAFIGIGMFAQGQTVVTLAVNQPAQLGSDAGLDQIICPWDSAMLGGVPAQTGGTAPFTYSWSPMTGVGNPSTGNTMANPMVSTDYVLTVTDARNCTSMDTVVVTVDTCVGISGPSWMSSIDVFPNPNSGDFVLKIKTRESHKDMQLNLLNPAGQSVYRKDLGQVSGSYETRVTVPGLSAGVYMLYLTASGHKISRQVIIH